MLDLLDLIPHQRRHSIGLPDPEPRQRRCEPPRAAGALSERRAVNRATGSSRDDALSGVEALGPLDDRCQRELVGSS